MNGSLQADAAWAFIEVAIASMIVIVATFDVFVLAVLLRIQSIVAIRAELTCEGRCGTLHVRWSSVVIITRWMKHVELRILGVGCVDRVRQVVGGRQMVLRAAWHAGLELTVAAGRSEKPRVTLEVWMVPAATVDRGTLKVDRELGGRWLTVLLIHAMRWVLSSGMARLVVWEWVRWLAVLSIVMARRLMHHGLLVSL